MALADSVPGVSGGTIAFILGFYDDFIGSLNSLTSIFESNIYRRSRTNQGSGVHRERDPGGIPSPGCEDQ